MALMSKTFFNKFTIRFKLIKTDEHAFFTENATMGPQDQAFGELRDLIAGLEKEGFVLQTSIQIRENHVRHCFVKQ